MSDRPMLEEQHEISIVNREFVTIKGVIHVDSFDAEEIVLDTDLGLLTIKGEDLHIKQLNLEQGNFCVEGLITALQYSAGGRLKGRKGKGFLDRLLK